MESKTRSYVLLASAAVCLGLVVFGAAPFWRYTSTSSIVTLGEPDVIREEADGTITYHLSTTTNAAVSWKKETNPIALVVLTVGGILALAGVFLLRRGSVAPGEDL